jgi:hypothetical protein
MRILYLGNFDQPWTTENYVARAFERAGHTVVRWHEATAKPLDVRDQAAVHGPFDLLLFAKARFGGDWDADPSHCLQFITDARPHCRKIVCWVWDLLNPGFRHSRYAWSAPVSRAVDLFCTTDGSTLPHLDNARLLRQAAPDDVRPGQVLDCYRADLLYLGDPYGHRRDFLVSLIQQYARRLFVVPDGFRGDVLADLIGSTRVVIGPHWPSYPGYWSNRLYTVAAHAGCLVTPQVEGMEEEGWIPWVHYLPVDIHDASDRAVLHQITCLADAYTAQPEQARRIGLDAQRLVRQYHTYDRRIATLLEWLA